MITITREHIDKIHSLLDQGLTNGLGKPEPGKMCVEAAICFALGLKHGDDPQCVMPGLRRLKIRLNDSGRWTSNKARAEGLRRLAIAQLGSLGAVDEIDFAKRVARMTIQTVVPSALRSAACRLTGEHPTKLLALALKCEQEPTKANAREANKAYAAEAAASAAAYAAEAAASAAYAAAYAADAAAYADADAADAADAAAYAADAAAYADADAAAYADAAAADAAADAAAYAAAYAADADAYADAAAEEVLVTFAENVVKILIEMKAPGCQWLEVA